MLLFGVEHHGGVEQTLHFVGNLFDVQDVVLEFCHSATVLEFLQEGVFTHALAAYQ